MATASQCHEWTGALLAFNLAMAESAHAVAAHHLMVMLDLRPRASSGEGGERLLLDTSSSPGAASCVEDEVTLACQLKLESALLDSLCSRFSTHVRSRAASVSPRRGARPVSSTAALAAAVEAAESVRVLWERCSVLGLGPKAVSSLGDELTGAFDRSATAVMYELDSVREIQSAAARQRKEEDATMSIFARTRRAPVAPPPPPDDEKASASVGAARAYLAAVSRMLDEASDAMGQVAALGLDEASEQALCRAVNVRACIPVARALELFLEHRSFGAWVRRVDDARRVAAAEHTGRGAGASPSAKKKLDAAVVDALLDEAALLCQMCHRYLHFIKERDAAMALPTDEGIGPLYIPLESLIAEYLLLEQAFLGYATECAFAASRAAFYAPRHRSPSSGGEGGDTPLSESGASVAGGASSATGGGGEGAGGGSGCGGFEAARADEAAIEPTTGAVVDDVVFIVHKVTQRASITLSARAAENMLSQAVALLDEGLHTSIVHMSRTACSAVTYLETSGLSSVLVDMLSIDAVPDEDALSDAIVMLNTLEAAPGFLRALHRELSEGVVRSCFAQSWEQFAGPLAVLETLSGRFAQSAAREIKRAADTILAPVVREVVRGAMDGASYDLDEAAFTLCEARDPWAKFLTEQLFNLDVVRTFERLCSLSAFADLVCALASVLVGFVEEGFVNALPISVYGAIQVEREVRVLERAVQAQLSHCAERSAPGDGDEAQLVRSAFAARTRNVQGHFARLRHFAHVLNVEHPSDLEREETCFPHAPALSAEEVQRVLAMRSGFD